MKNIIKNSQAMRGTKTYHINKIYYIFNYFITYIKNKYIIYA
jgi:hypothetical protein